ncbi:carboxylate-amine ligase [Streptomyces alfalfae]|uniref:carboxylate-amine ligase n=1 Tax=Streptomyces alfalfae TaxID=1642299 RepID=UPI0028115D00|nr:glutamate--cysteine ligase [Streptomyces alfalfae]
MPPPRARDVVNKARQQLGETHMTAEMSRVQVESVSRVCRGGEELAAELERLRAGAANAAAQYDCLLVPSGTAVLGDPGPPPILDRPRYHAIQERFGPLTWNQCVNSCHVHVGVDNLEDAVQVSNHLRLWAPVMIALTANSPFCEGTDTEYASWRSVLWDRWPSAGPPPFLHSAAHYEQVVASLVGTGAALDAAMIYWQARPSRHVPTVEVRVADVMPDMADTLAFALLVRALVTVALDAVHDGQALPDVNDAVLRGACWQAARWGLSGQLLDTSAPDLHPRPARQVVDRLWEHVAGRLEQYADLAPVQAWLDRSERLGTGAERQRRIVRANRGRLAAVVDALAVPIADNRAASNAARRPAE